MTGGYRWLYTVPALLVLFLLSKSTTRQVQRFWIELGHGAIYADISKNFDVFFSLESVN